MCYICHSDNKEVILKALKNELEKSSETYHLWNTTSINHILTTMSNNDGCYNQQMSVKILEKFLKWYKTNKPDKYLPKNGNQKMYSKKCIQNLLYETLHNTDLSQEELTVLYDQELNLDLLRTSEDSCMDMIYFNHNLYTTGLTIAFLFCGLIYLL